MKRVISFSLLLILFSVGNLHAQMQSHIELPPDLQAPHLRQLTTFGQRCDWSHDGKRLIFLEKTFGDVYEVDVATGLLTPLTHHFFHEGFTRALYLANGDILLSGSKTFDADDAWKSRKPPLAELWVLKRDLSGPPTRLGAPCKEGPTASRTSMKIAWTVDDIYLADIVYDEHGVPELAHQKTIITSDSLPSDVHGWRLETQNFRPPHDNELIFNAHYPSVEYEAEVMGYDFETGEIVNYSNRTDRYDEPEGIFPCGKKILVESTRHHPEVDEGRKVWDYIDLYVLQLDGSSEMERLTFFNDEVKYKATNPVVSDDGRYMAFQYSVVGETTGIGHGIVLWDFEYDENWEPLFNGRNLDGWRVRCTPEDAGKQFWTVENGTILCDSLHSGDHSHVWLEHEKEFSDFELRLKFQSYHEMSGNSGVQVRSRYDENLEILHQNQKRFGWLNGPQIDINPSDPFRNGLIYDETMRNQRWILPSLSDWKIQEDQCRTHGASHYFSDEGEGWNSMFIRCKGTKIQTWVNGILVSDYDGLGILDDQNHRDRRVGLFGHIALQVHTNSRNLIRYKDIEIRKL